MDVRIDAERYARRVRALVAAWTWPLDAIVLVVGKSSDNEGEAESKEVAMHFWLWGILFHETVAVVLKSGHVVLLVSQKKAGIFQQITTGITVLVKQAGPAVDEAQVAEIVSSIRGDKPKATVGLLTDSQHTGQFAESFMTAMKAQSTLQIADCKEELSTLLSPKDQEELGNIERCSRVAAHSMQEVLMAEWERVIDSGQALTNKQLCAMVEDQLEGETLMQSLEAMFRLESGELAPHCVSHQSGKSFSISASAAPDNEPIPMTGTYLLFIAFRYSEYAACIARTMFLHPTPAQQEAYTLLRNIHAQVVADLKPGALFSDIYASAKDEVRRKVPSLSAHFSKNVGFGTGLELADAQCVIREESRRRVEANTAFCVSVGFSGMQESGQPWAAWVADVVVVREGGAEVLTASCKTDPANVQFSLDQPEAPAAEAPAAAPPAAVQPPFAQPAAVEAPANGKPKAKAGKEGKAKAEKGEKAKKAKKEKPEKPEKPEKAEKAKGKAKAKPAAPTRTTRVSAPPAVARPRPQAVGTFATPAKGVQPRRFRERTEKTKVEMSRLAVLEEKQKSIRAKKLQEIKARFAAEIGQKKVAAEAKRLCDYMAYPAAADTPPSEPRPMRLQVDTDAQAVLVPLNGSLVPFHVSCVKNMTRSTVDRFQILQINFFTPGNGKSNDDFPAATPTRAFLKEVTFRSEARDNFDAVLRNFNEARKRLRQKELEGEHSKGRKQQAAGDAPSAEPLQLLRPFQCLRDLNVRPTLATGARRTVGTLEAHANGFRFSVKGSAEKVDILYSQIKHAVFEPCEKSGLIVLVHLHLRAPITLGKRRTLDIQFFAEVGPQVDDLSQRRAGSAYDPDEIMEEQNERLMKQKVNKWFQDFCKSVEEIKTCPFKFDVPFRDAAFTGVPSKSQVRLAFGSQVLCGLQEFPPLVISLEEVDIVVFERATMMLREFDMVLVMKDYDEPPIRITTIPKSSFDMIRSHLAEREMPWYSSAMNLQWAAVMKQVNSDHSAFVTCGGWDAWFVGGGSDSDNGSGSSDFSGASEEEFSDDHAPEEDGSDFSIAEDEEDDEGGGGGEDDEDGLDWEELERRAEKADRKRERSKSRDGGAGRQGAATRSSKRTRR